MAQVIRFTIRVDDEGTAVVEKFTGNVEDSAKSAKRSAGRMNKAFVGVRKGIGRVSGAVLSLRGLLVGLGATAVVRSVLRASFAQEEAVARVNATLRASGQFSDEASQALQEFASQMQATTIFGDEAILNQVALAQAFGFTTENVQEAVQAATELSAAAGIQLEEAVRRLGRSISGSIEDISKFAPEIRNLTKEQLAAGDAAKVLGDALRGSAAAQAETASGVFIQLGNALGDVSERIGQSITRSEKFQQALKGLTDELNRANAAAGEEEGGLGDALATLVPTAEAVEFGVKALAEGVKISTATFEGLFFVVNLFREDLSGATTEMDKATVAAGKQAKAQRDLGRATSDASKRIREAADANRFFIQVLADLNEVTPEAAESIFKTFGELTTRVAELPDSLSTTRDAIFQIMEDIPGITKEQNDIVIAELDRLTARFGQLPLEFESPLQRGAIAILDFLGLTRLSAEETTAAINGVVASFSTGLTFSTSEAASQFGQLSSQFQQGFQTLNALTEQANKFQELNTAQRAATIIGITGSLFSSLSALAGEGSRSQFEAFKAFAIAEAVVAASLGIVRALGEGGPFLGPALAATIAAQTAVQIQKIRSTQFGGGGAAPTAPAGGGAAGAAPAPLEPVAPGAPAVGAAPVAAGPQITISVSGFIGDEAELASQLGEIISEAQGDDVEFQV